jgi:hypothetical protein
MRRPAPALKKPAWLGRLDLPARIVVILYAALMMAPFRYHAAATGLDSSWAVAINLLHVQGAVHGRDFAFTYGPLSYLALPMPMGTNLEQALLFQAVAWLGFIGLLSWVALVRRVPLPWLLVFAFASVPGSGLLHWFGFAGPDFFLEITALLALAACAGTGSFLFFLLAIGIAVLLVFIKLTSGLGVLLAALAFPFGLFVFDRQRALWFQGLALLAFPAMALGFWNYEPSLTSLVRYVRAGWEISSGFTSVMGVAYPSKAVPLALVMALGYAALGVLLLVVRDRAFVVFAAGIPALFIEFKHAFVREAGHVDIFFCFAPLLVGIVLLASARFRWVTLAPLALILAPLYLRDGGSMRRWSAGPVEALQTLTDVARPVELRRRLETESAANLNADRLPAELLARVSGRTLTIFPWECSYAAANPIHYVPMPLLQAYSAYTEYLDNWNAQLFEKNSPDFVIFEWEAIDFRNPLLDVPATALALYRNYELDQNFGALTLLRKRAVALSPTLRRVQKETASSHPTVMKIQMQPTLVGRLRDFLFRAGEIDMTLTSSEGRYVVARVPPRVLASGVLFNILPGNLDGFRHLMSGDALSQPLDRLVLGGEGMQDYKTPSMELYELQDAAVHWEPRTAFPDLEHFISRGELDTTRIETLNTEGVVGISSREVLDISAPGGFLRLSGWVVAPAGSEVFVDLDGRLWRAQSALNRPDIKLLYGADRAGIEWFTTAQWLGHGPHHLQLKVVNSEGKYYYGSPQNVAFRIP